MPGVPPSPFPWNPEELGGSELPVPRVTLHLSPISVSPGVVFSSPALLVSLAHALSLSRVFLSPTSSPSSPLSAVHPLPQPSSSSAPCPPPACPPHALSLSPLSLHPHLLPPPSACSLEAEGLWGSVPVSLSLSLSFCLPVPPCQRVPEGVEGGVCVLATALCREGPRGHCGPADKRLALPALPLPGHHVTQPLRAHAGVPR